jgi:2-keto-4-pentenoate hydratase
MIDTDGLANRLIDEHDRNEQFRPFAAANGIASLEDSYAVQERYVSLLKPRCGAAVGYKIGLTSQRMQAMCGIGHPIGGVVLADRLHRSGGRLAIADYGRMGLEFEIAVRMGSDLPVGGPAWTVETIATHVAGVCAAIEIVDDRSADYGNLDVRSLVADNSWNAGIVLSDFVTKRPDLEAVLGRASKDGAIFGEGHGRDILGHPFNSAAWLATQLASRGESLKAGQVVMTGSVMKTVFPEEAASYRFELEGIGSVEVQVR